MDGAFLGEHPGEHVEDPLGIGGGGGDAVDVPANSTGLVAVGDLHTLSRGEHHHVGLHGLGAQNLVGGLVVGLLADDAAEVVGVVLGEIVPQQGGTGIGELLQELVGGVGEHLGGEQAFAVPLVGDAQGLDHQLVLQAVLDHAVILREVGIDRQAAAQGAVEGPPYVVAVIGVGAPEGEHALAGVGGQVGFLNSSGVLMQSIQAVQDRLAHRLVGGGVDDPLVVAAGGRFPGPVGDAVQSAVDLQHLPGLLGDILGEGAALVHKGLQVHQVAARGDLVQVGAAVHNDHLRQIVGGDHQVQLGHGVGVGSGPVDVDVELVGDVLGGGVLAPHLGPAGVVVVHGELVELAGVIGAGGDIGGLGVVAVAAAGGLAGPAAAGGGAAVLAVAAGRKGGHDQAKGQQQC